MVLLYHNMLQPFPWPSVNISFLSFVVISSTLELILRCAEISLIKMICSLAIVSKSVQKYLQSLHLSIKVFGNELLLELM
jgi:hypothetical protein